MQESTPELKRRLDQIERVNIPGLVSQLDPLRSECHRRRATVRDLQDHLNAVDAASENPASLASLAANLLMNPGLSRSLGERELHQPKSPDYPPSESLSRHIATA